MYQVTIYKKAAKLLKRIPRDYQIRIQKIIPQLEGAPFSLDIKKLGPPHTANYRVRVGDYRIFLDIDTTRKTIIIVEIERRTTQTYR